jgi:hypothetical protein
LALVLLVPPVTHGDEWNLATRFSINQSFEVPGMVLQANTPYVIRLHDSPSTRNVVQIYNEEQTRMLTMFMAISAERLEPADKTVFTFIETQPGFPRPVKEWFYPGRLRGLEFIYPKEQADRIALHTIGAKAPLTESASVTKSETTIITEEKPSIPEEQPVAENVPPEPVQPAVDQEQQVEQQNLEESTQVAQNEPPAQPEEQAQAPAEPENRELPRTAGELPLMAFLGIVCLGAGLGLKVLSAKS